jgi:uncharacterized protein YwqG
MVQDGPNEAERIVALWRTNVLLDFDRDAWWNGGAGVKASWRHGYLIQRYRLAIFDLGPPGIAAFAALLSDRDPRVALQVAKTLFQHGERIADAMLVLETFAAAGDETARSYAAMVDGPELDLRRSVWLERVRAYDDFVERDEFSGSSDDDGELFQSETLDAFRERLTADGWPGDARRVFDVARPCLRLRTRRVDQGSIPLGATRFGGMPDGPADFQWPYHHGFPLGFIAQIECTTIPASLVRRGFPDVGSLYFFYDYSGEAWGSDPKDRGNWLVFHTKLDPSVLVRIPLPEDVHPFGRFRASAAQCVEAMSFPSLDDPRHPGVALVDAWVAGSNGEDQAEYHQLGGYARNIQHVPEYEYDDLTEEERGGRSPSDLLLEVVSSKPEQFSWGDGWGSVYFLIEAADLREADFTNVRLRLQSG